MKSWLLALVVIVFAGLGALVLIEGGTLAIESGSTKILLESADK